jgi:hypothetical protein
VVIVLHMAQLMRNHIVYGIDRRGSARG